jgi:membrane protease YdiL (CAAX protease family)
MSRRRVVVLVTGLVGTGVLAWGLRSRPASGSFYAGTLGVAVVWTVGGALSGLVHLGWTVDDGPPRRPIIGPIVIGACLAAIFILGALVVRHIPLLADRVEGILAYARTGSWPGVLGLTVANGIGEEVFFRGALQPALPERVQLPGTVVIYALVTMATGNIMLGAASVVLGIITGLQRRTTGGILAPVLTHVTWSTLMLLFLPLVFR